MKIKVILKCKDNNIWKLCTLIELRADSFHFYHSFTLAFRLKQ